MKYWTLIFELAGWKASYLERYGVSKTPFRMERQDELLEFLKHLFLWDFSILETPKWHLNTPNIQEPHIIIYIYIYFPRIWCHPTFQLGRKLFQGVMFLDVLSKLKVSTQATACSLEPHWDFTIPFVFLLGCFGLEVCSMMSFWVYSAEAVLRVVFLLKRVCGVPFLGGLKLFLLLRRWQPRMLLCCSRGVIWQTLFNLSQFPHLFFRDFSKVCPYLL